MNIQSLPGSRNVCLEQNEITLKSIIELFKRTVLYAKVFVEQIFKYDVRQSVSSRIGSLYLQGLINQTRESIHLS